MMTKAIEMTDDLRAALEQLFPNKEVEIKNLEHEAHRVNQGDTAWAIRGAFYKKAFDLLHKEFPAAWQMISDGFNEPNKHEERRYGDMSHHTAR